MTNARAGEKVLFSEERKARARRERLFARGARARTDAMCSSFIRRLISSAEKRDVFDVERGLRSPAGEERIGYWGFGSSSGMRRFALASVGVLLVLALIVLIGVPLNTWG